MPYIHVKICVTHKSSQISSAKKCVINSVMCLSLVRNAFFNDVHNEVASVFNFGGLRNTIAHGHSTWRYKLFQC